MWAKWKVNTFHLFNKHSQKGNEMTKMTKIPVTRAMTVQQSLTSSIGSVKQSFPASAPWVKSVWVWEERSNKLLVQGKGPVLTQERRQVEEACMLGTSSKDELLPAREASQGLGHIRQADRYKQTLPYLIQLLRQPPERDVSFWMWTRGRVQMMAANQSYGGTSPEQDLNL